MTGRTMVTQTRVLMNVCPHSLKPQAQALKERVQPLVAPWTLDHGWTPGRSQQAAVAFVSANPDWRFIDVVSCFSSIDQGRMWTTVARLDHDLAHELARFCTRLGCTEGLPEGTSFSPALANIYLTEVDRRWAGRAIRCGDNWACVDINKLRSELLDLGLSTKDRPTFVGQQRKEVTTRHCRHRSKPGLHSGALRTPVSIP